MDRYLEDLTVGEKMETASVYVSEAEVLEFAQRYDPQPIHIDREAAERSAFKGLIASGWHTAALVMKLTADAKMLGNTPVLGLGVDNLSWPLPVRPGDTLRVVVEVATITPSKSKPQFGIVSMISTAYNQHGQIVFVAKPNVWVPRRLPAP